MLTVFVKVLVIFSMIFAGRQAIDGDTAQVGPQIAEKLGVPQITYAKEFTIEGDCVIVKRALEDGYERLKVKMPCVVTAIKELNTPRYMKLAKRIARRGPVALRMVKDVINRGLMEPDVNKGVDIEAEQWAKLFNTEDQKEGMKAFMEKRKPVFKNK